MTAPLSTQLARDLRQLARPRWQRRLISWTLPVAAGVLTGVHAAALGVPPCTALSPCRPDVWGSVILGLLFASACAGFIYRPVAPWLAGGFAITVLVAERLFRQGLVSPAWTYLLDLGFVGLCALLARVDQERPATGAMLTWLAAVRRDRPPAPGMDLPRTGRVWRFASVALLVLALACLAWGWYSQNRVDSQQRAASRVTGVVTSHVDEFTVEVRMPTGEAVAIGVLDVRNYPVGDRMELLVDDLGLRQPVSEPYDATGWVFLAVLLAGTSLACWLRGVQEWGRPRRLFAENQPVTEVYVLPGLAAVAVYAADARPGEPALAEIRTGPLLAVAGADGEENGIGAMLEPRLQPATLCGVPVPGRWCTVVVNGTPVVPIRPLRVTTGAPKFAYLSPDDNPGDPMSARPGDLPLRTEEVEALRPGDGDRVPDQVRWHVRSAAAGYAVAAAMPFALIAPSGLFSMVSYDVWLAIAGVTLAASCAIAWRLFMRGRIGWNGRGVAVVGAFGARRVPWRMVTGIDHDRASVTIHTGYRSLAVGAGPVLGLFGRGDRSAEELANALRHARSGAGEPADRGAGAERRDAASYRDVGADPIDSGLPNIDPPRPPVGLYLLWFVGTPVLAWIMQVFAEM